MANLTATATVFGTDTDSRSATPLYRVGTLAADENGNTYRYVRAGAPIARYDAVRFGGGALGYGDVRPTSAATQGLVGSAMVALSTGEYGFIQIGGIATVKVTGATPANSLLVPSSSGQLNYATAAEFTNKPAVALVLGVSTGSAVAFL
jgi:hypothetical protein